MYRVIQGKIIELLLQIFSSFCMHSGIILGEESFYEVDMFPGQTFICIYRLSIENKQNKSRVCPNSKSRIQEALILY
jgi:hypothetical protein